MQLLIRGKTLCSDEPKGDETSRFRYFVVGRKLITDNFKLKHSFVVTKFWQNMKL